MSSAPAEPLGDVLKRKYLERPWLYGSLTIVIVAALLWWTCAPDSGSRATTGPVDSRTEKRAEELALVAVRDNLNHLEQFDFVQMSSQLIEQLNQWLERQEFGRSWTVDPLVTPSLTPYLHDVYRFDVLRFQVADGANLQEAAWLRDISNMVAGDGLDTLTLAEELFDWTVRHVQLTPERLRPTDVAWQRLLFGRGEPLARAQIFILLARQQGLEVHMLAYPDPDEPPPPKPDSKDEPPRPRKLLTWIPALRHEGELYLFEHRLGTPIPGPGGKGIATLSQVADDDSLLRQLDLPGRPYPVTSANLQDAAVLIEASPIYLARRMHLLEDALAGKDKLSLTVRPRQAAERMTGVQHISEVRIWIWPYECLLNSADPEVAEKTVLDFRVFDIEGLKHKMIQREDQLPDDLRRMLQPRGGDEEQRQEAKRAQKRTRLVSSVLWKGRILQFKGRFDGEEGATAYLQLARPPDSELNGMRAKMIEELNAQRQQAQQLQSTAFDRVEGAEEKRQQLARNIQFLQQRIQNFDQPGGELELRRRGKADATYWLGQVAFQRGDYKTAAVYFERILKSSPDGPWAPGARYHLGRALEAQGKLREAIAVYEAETSPQQRDANVYRARRLHEQLAAGETGDDDA